jgi:hypothetical protein
MRPIILEEIVRNNQKTGFVLFFFFSFWGYMGTPKWPLKVTGRSESGWDVWSDV